MADWRNGKRKGLGFKMMKTIILGGIEYHVYQSKDKRIRAYYTDKDGKHITKSFPRILMEEKLGHPLKPDEDIHHHYQVHEQNRRDSIAECELNGESFPNGNAVPINNRKVIECVETVHSLS